MAKSGATKQKSSSSTNKLRPLQRLSLYFFNRPKRTAALCLFLVAFGVLSYTTLLKREGFPTINTPFALSQGTYLVNDPAKVDQDVAKPLSEFVLKQEGVKQVQTQSFNNFYVATVLYKDGVDSEKRSPEINDAIKKQHILPDTATGDLQAYKFGFTQRGDNLTIAFYSNDDTVSTDLLVQKADDAAKLLKSKNLSLVEDISIIDPFQTATNPLTGKTEKAQKTFERFGLRTDNTTKFHNAVVIGVKSKPKVDNLELDKQVQTALDELNKNSNFSGYSAKISASNAPQINQQVSELQRTLIEGLLAVLVVGSIVIAIRASLIIVLSMITVLATVNGLLYITGYTLNTITLFALILGLSLIVDDTIIMTEAIDAQRRRQKKAADAITVATGKISRAMVAATLTAALSFAPLLFVSGILGSFIRAIPLTIISALIISLFVALIFIPLFARKLLLGKKQMGENNVKEASAGIEAKIAKTISAPMLWAKNSKKRLFGVGLTAVFIGLGFIGAGGYLFSKVTFNIFPPSKDTNQISTVLTFPPNTTIEQAQASTDRANQIIGDTLTENLMKVSYYGMADTKSATSVIDLTDYKERDSKAPELVKQLEAKFKNFEGAQVTVGTIDAGPPASAFAARVDSSQNREAAGKLSADIAAYLKQAKLKRIDGSTAEFKTVTPPNVSIYNRDDNKSYLEVTASFVDDDTSTLVTLAKSAVQKEFNEERVASYGLKKDALSFSFGQEDENQDSFKTLALAFPALLVAIFFLLAFEFRSLLQPLLIFMALPFSLFGITLGLYLTDNAFSFFAMLGFFALIGLSIKNTILLTDYANQQRREGLHPVDAAHEALAERFRPLIATSITAVVSLIPLAITSPFWEGLAVVLIFGLLSSTFLVITVFPYYYLGAEYLRLKVSRRTAIIWIIISLIAIIVLSKIGAGKIAPLAPIIAAISLYLENRYRAKTS